MLTLERLREVLEYDASHGLLIWKVDRPRSRKGSIACSLNIATRYWVFCFENERYPAHRVAWLLMTGEMPPHEIDHKDGDRSNNRWSNLRAATKPQNSANKTKTRRNKSGFKGVSWRADTRKWQAHIYVFGKSRYLGNFTDPTEAHEAYKRAAHEAWGEFANAG